MILPEKKSSDWFNIFVLIFSFNLAAIIISKAQMTGVVGITEIIISLLVAIAVAVIASAGYFGFRFFSGIFIVTNIVAMLMLFLPLETAEDNDFLYFPGFDTYSLLVIGGIIVGLLIEIIWYFVDHAKELND